MIAKYLLRLVKQQRTIGASSVAAALLGFHAAAFANQIYEPLSTATRNALQKAVADQAVNGSSFGTDGQAHHWVGAMSERLRAKFPDPVARADFLRTVHYEATRAGLDPQLVLAVIQVESNFRKYAVSTAGARGFMQVMPFWIKASGGGQEHNLFHLRTNLRFGCVILRHYLDIEKGDLYRALGRYNGSLGKPQYPNTVLAAWRGNWTYPDSRKTAGNPSPSTM